MEDSERIKLQIAKRIHQRYPKLIGKQDVSIEVEQRDEHVVAYWVFWPTEYLGVIMKSHILFDDREPAYGSDDYAGARIEDMLDGVEEFLRRKGTAVDV